MSSRRPKSESISSVGGCSVDARGASFTCPAVSKTHHAASLITPHAPPSKSVHSILNRLSWNICKRCATEWAIDQIMTAGVDHLIMGIALETFWGGVAVSNKLRAELEQRAGVGVSMGSTAIVAALHKFGAKRISILTPHQQPGDDMVRLYMTEAGFEIIRLKGLKCPSPRAIAQVPLTEIRASLRELNGDDVDALVQVGTGLPAVAAAAEAEQWFGKPVLAVNTVTYWDALRLSGINDHVYGFGRIFEEH